MIIGFMASHNGSSARAIVDAINDGRLAAKGACLISNNSDAYALQWAREVGLPAYYLSSNTHPQPELLDATICHTLQKHGVEIVVLSGYMRKLGAQTLAAFHNRILNVHPSLLPKHGGQGMYGIRVHQSVLAEGEETTGITVHLVDEHYDHGKIVAQCQVPVLSGDTEHTLQARVQAREKEFYIEVLQSIVAGKELD